MSTARAELEGLLEGAAKAAGVPRKGRRKILREKVHRTRTRRASAKALKVAELIFAEANGDASPKVLLPLIQKYLTHGVDLVEGIGDRGFAERLKVFLNTNLPTLGGALLGSKE